MPSSVRSLLLLGVVLAFAGCAHLGGNRWGHPVHVTEAVLLSQHGVPPDAIVAKMNRAGTVYHLSETQYAEIREGGVTTQVIAYMKGTYSQALEAHPGLADDDDFSCWYLGPDGYWYGGGPRGFHPGC